MGKFSTWKKLPSRLSNSSIMPFPSSSQSFLYRCEPVASMYSVSMITAMAFPPTFTSPFDFSAR